MADKTTWDQVIEDAEKSGASPEAIAHLKLESARWKHDDDSSLSSSLSGYKRTRLGLINRRMERFKQFFDRIDQSFAAGTQNAMQQDKVAGIIAGFLNSGFTMMSRTVRTAAWGINRTLKKPAVDSVVEATINSGVTPEILGISHRKFRRIISKTQG